MIDHEYLISKIEEYQKNPVLFIKETTGLIPTKQQTEVMMEVAKPGSRVTVASGHGTGKTITMACLGLWNITVFPNSRTLATAPTAPQLDTGLFPAIGALIERMHPSIQKMYDFSLAKLSVKINGYKNTRYMNGRTARKESPDALQGAHADHMLFLVDEASGVADSIFEAARGTMSTPEARTLLAGNPVRNSGKFYETHCGDEAKYWTCFRLSCLDSPLVTDKYIQEVADTEGVDSPEYQIRVLGEFPDTSFFQFISRKVVEDASKRYHKPEVYKFAPKVLGVDVARYGDDKSVVMLRQGISAKIIGTWSSIPTDELADWIAGYYAKESVDAIFVDGSGGYGSGVVDRLRTLGHDPFEIEFGSRPTDPRYFNKRAEMWGEMKNWLRKGGSIPEDKQLINDLVAPEYKISLNGKLQLESKDKMKLRGLKSPDNADALALTFAAKVHVLTMEEQLFQTITGGNKADTEYNMYDKIGVSGTAERAIINYDLFR